MKEVPSPGKKSVTLFLLGLALLIVGNVCAADSSEAREGWIVGGVPALGYNSDKGFNYGVVLELYNFGDGSRYPNYRHGIHAEWSKTTRGSTVGDLFVEVPGILGSDLRVTAHLKCLIQLLQPYYGLNGYQTPYKREYEKEGADEYINRVYYTTDRDLWQSAITVQGPIRNHWNWVTGIGWFDIHVGPTQVEKIDDDLPEETLYSNAVASGRLPHEQADGGEAGYAMMGFVYDSRDRERTPTDGIWSEGLVTRFSSRLGSEFDFTILTLTHRQYFPLAEDNLTLATRAILQKNIAGRTPAYIMPYLMSSRKSIEGLGGSQTIRGVLQNRVVGESVVMANLEMRWRVHRIEIFNQEFYATLNGFVDTGRVVDVPDDRFHNGIGLGFSVVMNQNIVGSIDVAKGLDVRDGFGGIYFHSGYLF